MKTSLQSLEVYSYSRRLQCTGWMSQCYNVQGGGFNGKLILEANKNILLSFLYVKDNCSESGIVIQADVYIVV